MLKDFESWLLNVEIAEPCGLIKEKYRSMIKKILLCMLCALMFVFTACEEEPWVVIHESQPPTVTTTWTITVTVTHPQEEI